MKPMIENQQCDWMMKFLMGLNNSFSIIKAQIILLKPTPTLSEVYALFQQEEKRKQIFNLPTLHDTLALATSNHYPPKPFSSQRRDSWCAPFAKSLATPWKKFLRPI